VDEGLVCQAFTGWTFLKRWNLSRGWLAPVPYSNKEGSFRWGFCKINGAVLKCTFFAWPASTIHRAPTRRALSVGAFVKKVGRFQKCDIFAWPHSGIAAWPARKWDPPVRPITDFGSAKGEANTNKRFIFFFYKEKDENYL
jgi:hypothetical protein